MKELWKKYKGIVILVLTIFTVYFLLFLFGISCPIKYIFGVSCPGCGMTRATLSALRLDFATAFYYHPLWLLPLPSLILLIFLFKKERKRAFKGVICALAVAFLLTYFVRLFGSDNTVVTFSPKDSIIKRAIDFVFN